MASAKFFFDVDEMVEDSLAGTCTLFDDNYMSSIAQVEFPADKSPFHESDSGVSDITGIYGNSPLRETDVMLDELVDNKQFKPFGHEDREDDDKDLLEYLRPDDVDLGADADIQRQLDNSGCFKENDLHTLLNGVTTTADAQSRMRCKPVGGMAGPVTRRRKAAVLEQAFSPSHSIHSAKELFKAVVTTDESDVDIDADEDFVINTPSSKRTKGSVRITKPGMLIPKPNIQRVTTDSALPAGTSVKVLHVVHTSSGENGADEVFKVLEDRNRKNAEQAKLNRQRKKVYVQSLEKTVKESQGHVDMLQKRLEAETAEKDSLKQEVEYLKAVLANQSALAGLLKNIPSVGGVNLSSSFMSQKRSAEMDHSYTPNKKQCSQPLTSAGVCLHVDDDNVSLEFCYHCAKKARNTPDST